MNTHLRLGLVLICMLVAIPLAALPLSSELSFTFDTPLLGQDAQIGEVLEPEKGSSEAYTAEALGESYSPEWVSRYVSDDVRFSFIRTFDQDLSLLLPQTRFYVGKAVRRDESHSVPFRYGEQMRSGTFVWIEVSEGLYTLVSITLNP